MIQKLINNFTNAFNPRTYIMNDRNTPKDFDEMMRQIRGEIETEIEVGGSDSPTFQVFDMDSMEGIKADGQESLKTLLEQRQEAYDTNNPVALANADENMERKLGELIHRMVEQKEENPNNLLEAMNQFAGEVMLENSAVKFESAQEAFDTYEAIKEWLDELYDSEAPKYIDVPVALIIEFPDSLTYNEAQSIVATYEAVVVNG